MNVSSLAAIYVAPMPTPPLMLPNNPPPNKYCQPHLSEEMLTGVPFSLHLVVWVWQEADAKVHHSPRTRPAPAHLICGLNEWR